jgi:uncharacterized protein involved in exopolysaccharide biosynthesis
MNGSNPEKIRPLPEEHGTPAERERSRDGVQLGFDRLRDGVGAVIGALRRKRHVFFAVAGALFVLSSLAILLQTPLYESTAQMIIKVGRELVYQPEVGADRAVLPRDTQAVINSELAILRSEPVIEGVVERVGLERIYPDLVAAWKESAVSGETQSDAQSLVIAEAAERLRGGLETAALPETDVLQVSFRHPDPIVARDTVDALVEEFLDGHLEAFAQPEIVQFLTTRVDEYERRLAESESALREFQSAHPSFAHEQPQIVLLEERERVRTQIDDLDSQISSIRLSLLQDDAAISDARSQLLQLQVEESQLKGERRTAAREQRAVIQRFINARMSELDEQLQPVVDKRTELEARLDEIQSELVQLPALATEHRKLERQRNSDEEQFTHAVGRLRDARLSSEMDRERIASINVIQPARVAPRPIWPPSKPISVGIALVLAVVVGVLLVSLVDRIGPVGIDFIDRDSGAGAGEAGSKS